VYPIHYKSILSKPNREIERVNIAIVIIEINIGAIVYPGIPEGGITVLIDHPIDGKIVGILLIPPVVFKDKITVIVFLLVVLEVGIDGGLIEKGETQSGQHLIPIIVPVAPIGGIVVVEIPYPEKASVFKEE